MIPSGPALFLASYQNEYQAQTQVHMSRARFPERVAALPADFAIIVLAPIIQACVARLRIFAHAISSF